MQAETCDAARRSVGDVVKFLLQKPENSHYLAKVQDDIHISMRFATDGAKMTKNLTAVKEVSLLISDWHSIKLPSPDDEMTLYLYTGTEFNI